MSQRVGILRGNRCDVIGAKRLKFAIAILIKSILILFVSATAFAVGSNADAATIEIETASKQSLHKASACVKFKAPQRRDERCQRVSAQGSASSRTPTKEQLVLARSRGYQHRFPAVPGSIEGHLGDKRTLGQQTRRSPFWRIYAYAPRLRK